MLDALKVLFILTGASTYLGENPLDLNDLFRSILISN